MSSYNIIQNLLDEYGDLNCYVEIDGISVSIFDYILKSINKDRLSLDELQELLNNNFDLFNTNVVYRKKSCNFLLLILERYLINLKFTKIYDFLLLLIKYPDIFNLKLDGNNSLLEKVLSNLIGDNDLNHSDDILKDGNLSEIISFLIPKIKPSLLMQYFDYTKNLEHPDEFYNSLSDEQLNYFINNNSIQSVRYKILKCYEKNNDSRMTKFPLLNDKELTIVTYNQTVMIEKFKKYFSNYISDEMILLGADKIRYVTDMPIEKNGEMRPSFSVVNFNRSINKLKVASTHEQIHWLSRVDDRYTGLNIGNFLHGLNEIVTEYLTVLVMGEEYDLSNDKESIYMSNVRQFSRLVPTVFTNEEIILAYFTHDVNYFKKIVEDAGINFDYFLHAIDPFSSSFSFKEIVDKLLDFYSKDRANKC